MQISVKHGQWCLPGKSLVFTYSVVKEKRYVQSHFLYTMTARGKWNVDFMIQPKKKSYTKSLLLWLTVTHKHSVLVELERTVGQCDIASSIQPVISTG